MTKKLKTARRRAMSSAPYDVRPGRAHPPGATVTDEGTNFSVFSQHATGVELLLFNEHDDPEPVQAIRLDPRTNLTFHFWHIFVEGLRAGMHYAYRVYGPWEPWNGHRFNPRKVLIDPYAKGNSNALWDRVRACDAEDNLATSMRSVVIDHRGYDWEGDEPLRLPMSEAVVYEMHVGGFTKHPSSKVRHPGTFDAVIEKIPYLKALGITAVELLPVFEFDETETLRDHDGVTLKNYWGYSTLGFFAPDSAFCVSPENGTHLTEFRDMVKALHKAGIEVILDVVFNHTNEGNEHGPTINFRGFDNSIYYHLVTSDRQYYMDYSGCGNTVNCNHPVVDKMIVDCLEYWVREMHVDGFRFDEGSILSRGMDGAPMEYPPVIWNIELSETLMDAKTATEAWDAAGLYQIGYFPGYRWAEWNGKYRDVIRRFVRGDPGLLGDVAKRIAGSADLYESRGHLPVNSVNFVTCHDGFTLNDLVSYNEKHNFANGEGNNDGANDNLSWNCGVEGPTDDPAVNALRERQVRNFAALLFVSQGVPMFTMGDEVRRTQDGNNNTYCQDGPLSWMDWDDVARQSGVYRFFKQVIGLNRRHPALHRARFFTGALNERGLRDIEWHGPILRSPGWDDPNARTLAFTLAGAGDEADIHVIANMYWEGIRFELPAVPGRRWFRFVDTSLPSPQDAADRDDAFPISAATYDAAGRSVVILVSGE